LVYVGETTNEYFVIFRGTFTRLPDTLNELNEKKY